MKRKFTKHPSSVTAGSRVHVPEAITFDESKFESSCQDLFENGSKSDRYDDIDWDMFDSPEDIDIETYLYVVYGLYDGEDYQIMNGLGVMITDTANGVWKQVVSDLC